MESKLDTIIELLEKIELNTRTYNGYAKWSIEQEELVDIMYNEGKEINEIIAGIKEKFNIERTAGAITARLGKIGLGGRRNTLSIEEEKPVSGFKKRRIPKEEEDSKPIMDGIYDDAPF